MTTRTIALLVAMPLLHQACAKPAQEESPPATTTAAAEVAATVAAATGSSPLFEVAPQHAPTGDIEFKAALDLGQKPAGFEPQLRNGRVAASKEWPASLYVTFQTPSGTASCTAALIGPQAMLTAAHCVPTTGKVSFRYKKQPEAYPTRCTQHPQYVSQQDASADFALCKVDRPFAAPAGFLYERVDTGAMSALTGAPLVLTGYGCINDVVADAQFDDKYRIGFNKVDETSASPQKKRGAAFYTPGEDNNLFTADDAALANLCPGDSGGPAFRRNAGPDVLTSRSIIGVNSRVFYRGPTRKSYGSSMVSATGGPDFRTWAQGWAGTEQVAACGLAGTITNCRN